MLITLGQGRQWAQLLWKLSPGAGGKRAEAGFAARANNVRVSDGVGSG